MQLSEEAYHHWEVYGYDPYNEEHWRYAQQQAEYGDWLDHQEYTDYVHWLDGEWLEFMEAEH